VPVAPGVFVPRRRTELLARAAVRAARPGAVVAELCCGAGAVSMVVASAVPVTLHAADVAADAVACAAANLASFGGRVYRGDLYAALPPSLRGTIDVLVANAPYIPSGAIALLPPEARLHEPLVALDGGADGLDVQRRIGADAPSWLAPAGTLLIETSEGQAPTTAALMEAAGLAASVERDENLDATVVIGRLPR
jgi:release factor glutamine methyltransferase